MNDSLSDAFRLELEGRADEAVEAYERLLSSELPQKETAVIRKHLGNLHFRLGHLRQARRHLTRACEIDPNNAAFWHDRGVVEYHMVDFDAAVLSLRKALEEDPQLQLAYFWLGNALYHRGELEQAARSFQELLERYPNFTIARFHLGVIFARQGRRREAEEEFGRVLSKNPEDAAAAFYVEPRTART